MDLGLCSNFFFGRTVASDVYRWLSAMSSAVAAEKKQPTHIDDVSSQIIAPPVDEIITDSLLDVTDSILDPIDQYVSMCYV